MDITTKYFNLKNKIAVVTGGTGVLGSQMANALASAGALAVILGRNTENGEEIVSQIDQAGGKAHFIQCDVVDQDSVENARNEIEKLGGRIDILINAAGGNLPGAIVTPDQTIHDLDIGEFRKAFDLNLLGTVIPTKLFTDLLLKSGSASIVNISSMAAQRPISRVAGYGSAKAAIDNFTKWLAVEMNHKYGEKIRVNAIAPGFFITNQNRSLLTNSDGSLTDRGQKVIDHTPANRFGLPEDLDGTVL